MSKLIPAYIWTQDETNWNKLLEFVGAGDSVVVTGPFNGPPREYDPHQDQHIKYIRAKKADVLGYVNLFYGAASIGEVVSSLCRWKELGVNKIFFDQVYTQMSTIEMTKLAGMIPTLGRGVRAVFNKGSMSNLPPPAQCLVVTYEGPYSSKPSRAWTPWEAAIAFNAPFYGEWLEGGLVTSWATMDGLPNPYDNFV